MLVNTSWGFTNFLNFFQTQRSWTKRLPKQTASVYFQINHWLGVFKRKNKQKPGLIVAESYWLDISAFKTEIKRWNTLYEKLGSLGLRSKQKCWKCRDINWCKRADLHVLVAFMCTCDINVTLCWQGHTSNANLLLNNSEKYGDNFLTVNLPIFKSLYMRHSSTVPHVKRRKCSSDNFILTNFQYENYLNVFVFVFFFLPFGWHWEALHNNIFPATSHRADIAID